MARLSLLGTSRDEWEAISRDCRRDLAGQRGRARPLGTGCELVADHAQRAACRTHLGGEPGVTVEHRRHDPSKALVRKASIPGGKRLVPAAAPLGRLRIAAGEKKIAADAGFPRLG